MKHVRLRCIFMLPLIVALIYFGASVSNLLPESVREKHVTETLPGSGPADGYVAPAPSSDEAFREPEWIDFTVCRLLYSGLSEKEQEAYRALYDAVLEHRETVYIPTLSAQELGNVHAALKYDNPQLPCISDEFSYGSFGALSYVKMEYDYTRTECDALCATLIGTARSVCADCEGRDVFDRELYLHDMLVRLSDYSDGGLNSNNAAGALVDRKAVCAGYALAMKLMCDISGIESCVIRGTAESETGSEAHAWLVVRINGAWYHVDPTWDDPVNEYDGDQLTHAYFNLPTAWISADHRDFTLPPGVTCDDDAENYYVRSGLFCNVGNWKNVVRSELARQLPTLPVDIELRFLDASLFDNVYSDMMDGAINKIINELIRENSYGIERWRVSIQTFNSMNCLRLIISDDNT